MLRTGKYLFLILLFLLCLFLSFNKHSKDKAHSYHGVIWADAAGYYVYQPMWFIYGNNAKAFPDSVDVQTGNGFYLDSLNNKVITKYYCGTAILETPFFLVSHVLAKSFGYKADGFSKIYCYGLYFSGAFYCSIALFLLSLFLRRHFSSAISMITPLLFLASTNLYYYSIDAPGMSHVYSFFLFSLFIFSAQKLLTSEKRIYYILFTVSFVLAVLTRPTNALIIAFPLFYWNKECMSRIKILLKQKGSIFIVTAIAVICVLPQLLYLKNISGGFFTYSYGNETFTNLGHPHLLETWFSPNNGLFIYAPVLFLSVTGMVLMIRQKDALGYFLLFVFLFTSYLFASWWCWWFGCSLGARSFVEFYAFLSIPMAFCIREAWKKNGTKYVLITFSAICILMYFRVEYYYDGCFYGETWDFKSYLKLLQ